MVLTFPVLDVSIGKKVGSEQADPKNLVGEHTKSPFGAITAQECFF